MGVFLAFGVVKVKVLVFYHAKGRVTNTMNASNFHGHGKCRMISTAKFKGSKKETDILPPVDQGHFGNNLVKTV